jgi:hypothetical protein
VTSTLADLERRLVELENELSSVAGAASGPELASPPPPPPPPRAVTAPGPSAAHASPDQRVAAMREEVSELLRFRDQLETTARDLVAEYDRVVARVTEEVTVEAGPFEGIGAVAAFEEQLNLLPGVHEARVRRYKGDRAVIDVQLEG